MALDGICLSPCVNAKLALASPPAGRFELSIEHACWFGLGWKKPNLVSDKPICTKTLECLVREKLTMKSCYEKTFSEIELKSAKSACYKQLSH